MENIQLFGRTITPEQMKLGVIGLAVVMGLALFMQNDLPKIQEWMALRGQLDETKAAQEQARRQTLTEPQARERLARVQQNLGTLRSRFPPRGQILSILLVDLQKIFTDSHNQLLSFQPKEFTMLTQASLKDLGKISIDIQAKGSYPSVILLFDMLSRYERVLTIENPTLSPSGDSKLGNELQVNFTLTTYALNQ